MRNYHYSLSLLIITQCYALTALRTAELLVARRGAAALPRSQCVKVRKSRLPITRCAHAVYSKQWRPALASMIAIFPLHVLLAEYFACQAANEVSKGGHL